MTEPDPELDGLPSNDIIEDPVLMARAARAARDRATDRFQHLERNAIRAVVARHGGRNARGALAAAAREIGTITPQAIGKIVAEAGADAPVDRAARPEPVAARYFANPDAADAALRDWALQVEDLLVERDALVRGALSANLSPGATAELTRLPVDVVEWLAMTGSGTRAVDVPWEVWEEVVERLADLAEQASGDVRVLFTSRAEQLAQVLGLDLEMDSSHPLGPPEHPEGWEQMTPEAKSEWLMAQPPSGREPRADVSPLLGPDGWAARCAAQCAQALAADEQADAFGDVGLRLRITEAIRQVKDLLEHVRTTGRLPQPATEEAVR